ncbi:Hpt domain-containing protein [Flavobacterium aciduliphilum]|jgi:HPt (histidine-containing phosphotransfer) domain-containing protein|uniref:HPt (Histidine-containing phosphotransfer) domain-containing protein n=1 Tax=Flavobacterium aciduliphilum TaxID=1101402 RepID=A0A328YNI2_9FLAO|nr:Hpt domain-containing protein [Flavobacterium aciduliphilum]RAR75648.1 HPt (histidine-containing phosphotransfer) domain-containing protein [Flavobacterium aciduliphilum]
MALHYNLSKVYALSDNDSDFVLQIMKVFIAEVPHDLMHLESGIEEKNYSQTYSYAHKLKPTLDLLGMEMMYDEILQIESWTKAKGKRKEIEEVFKSLKAQLDKAIKEIKKDFNL